MSIYYDPTELLSHNALFHFLTGARGIGKTYGFKKLVIKRYLKKKRKFIYLRRYNTEFEEIEKFFADISHEFPGHTFEVKAMTFYIDGEVCGYAVALSTALKKKSTSYPDVDYIVFDEFVIDSKVIHYLRPSEPIQFLEFYETVARMRENVRVVFLSNNVTTLNPYYLYFNLNVKKERRFQRFGHMIVENIVNQDFVDAKLKTKFGQIISGTKYGDYAILNETLKDNEHFIEKKEGSSHNRFTIQYGGQKYGVWVDYKKGLIYLSEDFDPCNKISYTLTDEDHEPNLMLIKGRRKNDMINQIIEAYEKGFLRFENMKVKNQGLEMIKMLC